MVCAILDNLYDPLGDQILEIPLQVIESAKSEIKQWLITNDFNTDAITEYLLKKPWGQTDRITYLVSEINKRKNYYIIHSILEYNSSAGEVITDFDWALKLILGTSQLRTLYYPVLQLSLQTLEKKHLYRNTVYDIQKEVLSKIINLLESNTLLAT